MLNHVKIKLLRKPKREKFFIFFYQYTRRKLEIKRRNLKEEKLAESLHV